MGSFVTYKESHPKRYITGLATLFTNKTAEDKKLKTGQKNTLKHVDQIKQIKMALGIYRSLTNQRCLRYFIIKSIQIKFKAQQKL